MFLVDWQLTRYCPPVIDLIYYIFTATDKELRDNEFENLLNLYHTTLSDHVRKLGSDPEKLYNYTTFRAQLKQFGKFAILLTPLVIQVLLADSNEVADLDNLTSELSSDKDVKLVKEFSQSAKSTFITRIKGIVEDLLALNLYWN